MTEVEVGGAAEERAMARALDLARGGWGRVHPNPLVGCVILSDGQTVGEGYHREFGAPHAEVEALRAAGEHARGGTAVITLEPCRHEGKTPPCVRALIEAGVGRVVVAVRDPTPEAGGGLAELARSGVDTAIGVLEREAAVLNAPFLCSALNADRPFVALKLAMSVDARIADADGRAQWISGEAARRYVHWLRAGFEAIAVGGTTALTDDPKLTARGEVTPRVPPVRVVFDRRAMLNPGTHLVRTAGEVPTWVVASLDAPAANAAVLEAAGVRVLRPFDLAEGLALLRAEGVRSVLVEGGGHLGGKLLADGLVDRLYAIQAPLWLGVNGRSAFAGIPDRPLSAAPRWFTVERQALGEDTLIVVDRSLCLPAS